MASGSFRQSFKFVSSGDMSGSVTSPAQAIQPMDNVGIQVNVASGSATGVFDVQVSADYAPLGPAGSTLPSSGNWISLGAPYTAAITSGNPTSVYFDLNQLSSQYVRIVYTRSSGTGVFDAFIVAKALK